VKRRVKAGTSKAAAEQRRGLTPQQEKFSQLVAMGMNQSAAYRESYNAKRMKAESVNELACRLAANVKVRSRVEEIRKPVVEQVRYDLKKAMTEAEQAMTMGLCLGQTGAVVSAIQLRAKLNGLLVEERKNERDPFTELSDADLDRAIAEADRVLAAAGSAGDGAGQIRARSTH
jgi:predicted house-cleaning NTP pyrophosphatase (Maf/HAM1 superfamily)